MLRRLPLRGLEREAAPVWLDDHRVACQTEDRTTYRWFDLDTGEQGEIADTQHGSTYWLARSPRDGSFAMWRMGPPGAIDASTEHLWIAPAGREPRPIHVAEAARHYLMPSWSPDGELLVRALDTGAVWRVALDTGELTPFAQLAATPLSRVFDDHLMILADGDLLAVEIDLGISVVAIRPDDATRPGSPVMTEQL
jgi:dipeptidyl aminopeptidase/acylaminoacyl peptidase